MSHLAEPDQPTLPLHLVGSGEIELWREHLPLAIGRFLTDGGFTGAAGQVGLIPGPDGLAGAVFGLGDRRADDPYTYGALPFALPAGSAWHLDAPAHPAAVLLGWCLGAYRYERFKPARRAPARLRPPPGTQPALDAAAAVQLARDLVNTPANHLGPAELAQAVAALARAHGARCTILDGAALEEGFPALAAVGAGSPRRPRVAMLEWVGPGSAHAPLVALCGKGVCFDTGGLDLKPSSAMLRMKKDMGGAAIMLGVADLLMQARLPIRLLLLIGAVENAISGDAMRPMDVLRTRAGLTVEVGNTDAEGRLVLCDLLACAAERRPALMIDAGTLTGAARVALGPDLPALFTPDDRLAEHMLDAGLAEHDPMWRLPLHPGYAGWLDSGVADLATVATKPMAGAIIGALFLRRFVPDGLPWAHLDVYAWNDTARPGRPEGGEAQAMRATARAIAAFCDVSPADPMS